MTDQPKEMSDLSMSRAECPKCGATWINGQHRWSGTGVRGSEIDLAGLVCNRLGDFQCINPKKGQDGGDTWEKRLEFLDKMRSENGESL
jgi:hypothetical protein